MMEDMDLTCMEDALFDFNTVWFENAMPDISVVRMRSDTDLANFVMQEMEEGYIQTIINNLDPETRAFCPYFRVFMDKFGNDSPINFKLQSFFNRIGMSSLNSRCRRALVVGLHALDNLTSGISVPMAFCTTSIDPIRFYLDEVDLACLSPCAKDMYPSDFTLSNIAGLSIPYHLPPDLQWKVLSYLRSPEAEIVNEAILGVCVEWDMWMAPMFHQREPRIPVDIASYYAVPTALTTIAGATKPFLVPSAEWTINHADRQS
jgi:hypothetical protein